MGQAANPDEVDRLVGWMFFLALEDAKMDVIAFKEFRKTFSLDGEYAKSESLYQEMYRQITASRR
jgi:hypothetical protein